MKYPKPIMSKTEMHKVMGYSMDYLNRIVHHKYAEKFCWKKNEKAGNSKYFFDTEEFEKLRKKGVLN